MLCQSIILGGDTVSLQDCQCRFADDGSIELCDAQKNIEKSGGFANDSVGCGKSGEGSAALQPLHQRLYTAVPGGIGGFAAAQNTAVLLGLQQGFCSVQIHTLASNRCDESIIQGGGVFRKWCFLERWQKNLSILFGEWRGGFFNRRCGGSEGSGAAAAGWRRTGRLHRSLPRRRALFGQRKAPRP